MINLKCQILLNLPNYNTLGSNLNWQVRCMLVFKNRRFQPLYLQLYAHLREEILSGRLPAETKLPSARQQADDLGVSRNTVDWAYQQLSTEGYIESKSRRGYYVLPFREPVDHRPLLNPGFQCTEVKTDISSSFQFDFHPAKLANESFPIRVWSKLGSESIRDDIGLFSLHGSSRGEPGLRNAIQKYLSQSRGVVCSPEQVIICSGVQDGLSLLSKLMAKNYSACAIEDPGYLKARTILQNHAVDVVPVPVRQDGIDIGYLTNTDCKAVYVTPSHQFPLGYVMPISRRLNLLAWAERVKGLIIEDDYDSEFRYQGQSVPSLQGIDSQGKVVYLGTFSKSLSPSLRLGYMILPLSLLELFNSLFRGHICSVPLWEQRILQKFLEQGYWDRHLRKMRTFYRRNHTAIINSVHHFLKGKATILSQGAGLHIVIEANGNCSAMEISKRAKIKGVRVYPISDYLLSEKTYQNALILGFGGLSPKGIFQGIELLSQAWTELESL